MTTSKAFDDALYGGDDSDKEISPDVVIDEATGIILSGSGNKLIQNHEALALIDGGVVSNPKMPNGNELRYALGDRPRFNVRTRFIEIGDKEYNLDELSRFYLQLSNHKQKWSKEMTVDAVLTVAELNEYDPIAVYLHNLSHVQPLPDKDWFNLDQF